MRTVHTDVLVIGAGPAGLTASVFLAKHGVDAITVTKYQSTANSPRAHITNQRTMEVFRDLGIEDRITAVATPNELMGDNVWATSFAGTEIARLKTWGTGIERRFDYESASPSSICNIAQHLLEPLILDAARNHDADVRFSTELLRIEQDSETVSAIVGQRDTGEEYEIRARYVIGADGGRSTVAQQLGFPFEGEMGLGAAMNIWLEADLSRYTEYRPGTLYWMAQPGNDYWVGSGTWICVKPWTEWVLLCMYDPAAGAPDTSHQDAIRRARQTIGDPDVDVRIKGVSLWEINRMVATEFRRGRVFLAGDAAHRHPPANGLGTNTSIQDAYNLAWKLAYVLDGRAGAGLLDSYDAERRPVGTYVVDRAMRSVADMLPISQALGFRPGQSEAEGWATLDELFADTATGRARRAQLSEAVQLQNYQFNAHGVELGQQYRSMAVIPDGTELGPPDRDRDLYYVPTTHPGARLPHCWLQQGTSTVSTLDLVGGGRFTLLTGIGGESWREAAAKAGADLGVELVVESVGWRCTNDDVLGDWTRLRATTDGGALLVRPDQHVAARWSKQPDQPQQSLRDAMSSVLAR